MDVSHRTFSSKQGQTLSFIAADDFAAKFTKFINRPFFLKKKSKNYQIKDSHLETSPNG